MDPRCFRSCAHYPFSRLHFYCRVEGPGLLTKVSLSRILRVLSFLLAPQMPRRQNRGCFLMEGADIMAIIFSTGCRSTPLISKGRFAQISRSARARLSERKALSVWHLSSSGQRWAYCTARKSLSGLLQQSHCNRCSCRAFTGLGSRSTTTFSRKLCAEVVNARKPINDNFMHRLDTQESYGRNGYLGGGTTRNGKCLKDRRSRIICI